MRQNGLSYLDFVRHLTHQCNSFAPRLILAILLPLLGGPAIAQLLDSNLPGHISAQAPASSVRQTPRPVLDGTATLIAHYDPTKMLRLAISLNLPHPAEEAQFLEELQNKQSPLFHRYPSSAEWDARFGPSVEDEQTVVDWAKSQGFTITFRYPNRLIVDVEAPVGVIEKALHLTINTYEHQFTDGRPAETVFSNDRDPVLPADVDLIVHGVHGLNSFEHYSPGSSPHSRVTRPDYIPGPAIARGESAAADAIASSDSAASSEASPAPQLGAPPGGYYQPTDIWSAGAYDYLALMNQGHCCNPTGNPGSTTPTTSIAIAAFGDVNFNDIKLFHQTFPYLAYNLEKVRVNGGYGTCATPDDSNCDEVTMDAEWALATSNNLKSLANTAKVFLYEASSIGVAIDVFNQMLTDGFARTFTMSFVCAEKDDCIDEGTMQDQDKVFAKMVGMGWTLVAASGDHGSTGACDDKLLVEFPASDPYVIAAGGTTLELGGDLFSSEIGWVGGTAAGSCSNDHGGSTGGFSYLWPSPGYQSGMLFTMRAVPDLALNANVGQIEVINGAFAHNAGTSIVSPELAGFFAQENAYLLSIGNACGASGTSPCAPLGDAHYPIYAEALNPTPGVHVPFYDITSGCSSNDITAKDHLMAFCAEKGYDEVTGWGSANMLQLAWAINWESTAASGIPYTVFSGPAVNHWYNSNQNVSWTINDYTAGSPVGTGIAGFSQGWDSIPTDSRTQPHGETTVSTDTFYTGPHFHNTNTGCLALASGKACFGGVTQGCHTAHVRGWNNQGLTTGDTTYGPVCYDTIAPTAHIALSGTLSDGVYLSSVAVTLSASDPGAPTTGSGVKAIYFVLDGGSPTVYFGPITVSTHGAHTIQYYSSDEAGNVEAHQSTTFSIKSTTTTTLDSSANPAKYGAVTFNATVKPTSGSTPTGTVTFKDGATILGSAGLSTAGVASYMATTLSVGSHTITAVYSGSSTDLTSTSAAITEVVTATTTTTKVTSDLNPAPFGSNILLNATISAATGATPSGNITFKDGTTTLATLTVNAAGVATYTTDNLAVGSHSITAVYVGDTDDLTSTSTVLTQTIQPADTTTKVTSSLNPAPFGSTVTFKASVTAPSSGITPTGTGTFKNGTSVLGTATLTSGSASLAVDTLTVGTHFITAVYSADKDYATSTSTPLSESITADN